MRGSFCGHFPSSPDVGRIALASCLRLISFLMLLEVTDWDGKRKVSVRATRIYWNSSCRAVYKSTRRATVTRPAGRAPAGRVGFPPRDGERPCGIRWHAAGRAVVSLRSATSLRLRRDSGLRRRRPRPLPAAAVAARKHRMNSGGWWTRGHRAAQSIHEQ